tara:strand:- start:703 stop:981 length:279 start_codon:yes stop_codon:yes gene_type:complete
MNEFAWSNGTKPERSYKKKNTNINDTNANNLALLPEWQIPETTKREEVISKINERELVGRMGRNPFLTDTTYSQDIETQQNFLIPKNSNNTK